MVAQFLGSAIRVAAAVALGSVLTSDVSLAASPVKLLGAMEGSVRDSSGTPQMGAVVQLFNRLDKPLEKAITNARGEFGFNGLLPDLYTVRVTLASFMPALKRGISIQPGVRSVLAINLAGVLSSVELVYSAPNSATLMNDDWKWVLRSSMTTRPVLRIFEGIDISDPNDRSSSSTVSAFSDTRGVVRVSSGDASPFSSLSNQPDLGTTFALATSLYGNNQLQFTGNIGYGTSSNLPATGFRTSYSRADMTGPEVKVMMQQVNLPSRGTPLIGGHQGSNAPALRSMSVTLIERTQVGDGINLDYGVSLDSVTFLDRLNYLSPFALLTMKTSENSELELGYSSGAPPVELLALSSDKDVDAGLLNDMTALSVLPRVTLRNGAAYVQRTQNFEIGYTVHLGARTFSIGAYKEAASNGALTLSSPDGAIYPGDLMPELFSNSSVFNIGLYSRYGYMASVTQRFSENYSATLAYGRGGVLANDGRMLRTDDPDELRSALRSSQRHWVRGRVAGIAPVTGTRFAASYEWTDYRSLTPGHVYLTQKIYPEIGLNVRVRQPLPSLISLPGRLEASAEMRNLLAQGYLSMSMVDGRRLTLAHSPRSVRGGVSFIF